MVRPRMKRRICVRPKSNFFKPQGIPLRHLDIISLTHEEMEALRLKNIQDLDQKQAAKKMNTSPSTFQRILNIAYKKITKALVDGNAIEIKD